MPWVFGPLALGTSAVGRGPVAVASVAETDALAVVNALDNSLSFVDAPLGQLTGTVPVGALPLSVATDPLAVSGVVANALDDTLTLFDTTNPALQETVALPYGTTPTRVALDAFNRRIDVGDAAGNVLVLVGPQPRIAPRPRVEVEARAPVHQSPGGGDFSAVFGYDSAVVNAVQIPIGSSNNFNPSPEDRGQPTIFQPGRERDIVTAFSNGQPPDARKLEGGNANANRNDAECASLTPTPSPPARPPRRRARHRRRARRPPLRRPRPPRRRPDGHADRYPNRYRDRDVDGHRDGRAHRDAHGDRDAYPTATESATPTQLPPYSHRHAYRYRHA